MLCFWSCQFVLSTYTHNQLESLLRGKHTQTILGSRQSLYNKRGDILYHNLYNRSEIAQYTVSYTSILGACLIGIGHRMSGLAHHINFIFLNQVKAMSVVLDEEHQRQKKLISLLLFV